MRLVHSYSIPYATHTLRHLLKKYHPAVHKKSKTVRVEGVWAARAGEAVQGVQWPAVTYLVGPNKLS